MRKFFLKRLLVIPLGVLAFIITKYAQYHPAWTEEVYSRSVYPVLSSIAGFLPSLVSFSFTEWLVILFIFCCLGYIIFYIRKAIGAKGQRGMVVYRSVAGGLAIFSAVYVLFTALCGLNYYRYTFASYTGYEVVASSEKELETLCQSLASEAGKVRAQLSDNQDLYTFKQKEFKVYKGRSVAALKSLAKQYPALKRPLYSAPKPVVASKFMSYAGITGVFFPFTLESNINISVPFFTVPATMAHELAHQCGFMREDEANFIAYLACKELDDDPLMRYSGLYLALTSSLSALNKVNPELVMQVKADLSPAVLRDMAEENRYWTKYEGTITNISTSINDTYLKANNQTDGVVSYGRMVDLLLAEQRAAHKAVNKSE